MYRAPLHSLLSIIGVSLGVAAIVAVDIANHSARESFLAASEALKSASTHSIDGEVSDELYRRIRLETPYPAQPLVQGRIRIAHDETNFVTIYGIDPIAYFQFEMDSSEFLSTSQDVTQLLSNPYSAFATKDTLSRLGVGVGDSIKLRFGSNNYDLQITGLIETDTGLQEQSLRSVMLTDIATAQTLLHMRGKLSSIQLKLPANEEANEAIETLLPLGSRLEGTLNRQQSIVSITEAFQVNLTAMSLLALLVAIFLIYNTTTFLVMRRAPRVEILRALGVSSREIFACFIAETFLIGVIASAIGFAFGVQISEFLLALVERSINNLYFPIEAGIVVLSRRAVALALLLGVGVTTISSLPAMYQASIIKPSFNVGRRRTVTGRRVRYLVAPAACVVLALLGYATIQINPTSIGLGFFSIYLFVAGYLCMVPLLCNALSKGSRNIAKRIFGIRAVLASRAFAMTGGRTSVAICALCIAISATVGVGVMISSFRTAVDDWLVDRLSADIYISTRGYGDELSVSEVERLQMLPGVDMVGVANWTWLTGPNGRTRVFAVDYGESSFFGYRFKEQDPQLIWQRFQTEGVIVSEPYSWKHGVVAGDMIQFWNEESTVEMPVLGVYYDYSSDRGIVAMHRDVFTSNFGDETIKVAALFASPDTNLESLVSAAEAAITSLGVKFWSARGMHEASMEIFDQTFAITAVLRSLAVVVAFIAVVSVLAMMQIDREHELRIQNAIGFTSRQIFASASIESGVMGLFAGLLSLPVGLILTWLLIWVVNQRSFGWTMHILVDSQILIEAVVLAVVASVLAGVVPAWRLAKQAPRQVLRAE